jgi:hypothetical protein
MSTYEVFEPYPPGRAGGHAGWGAVVVGIPGLAEVIPGVSHDGGHLLVSLAGLCFYAALAGLATHHADRFRRLGKIGIALSCPGAALIFVGNLLEGGSWSNLGRACSCLHAPPDSGVDTPRRRCRAGERTVALSSLAAGHRRAERPDVPLCGGCLRGYSNPDIIGPRVSVPRVRALVGQGRIGPVVLTFKLGKGIDGAPKVRTPALFCVRKSCRGRNSHPLSGGRRAYGLPPRSGGDAEPLLDRLT